MYSNLDLVIKSIPPSESEYALTVAQFALLGRILGASWTFEIPTQIYLPHPEPAVAQHKLSYVDRQPDETAPLNSMLWAVYRTPTKITKFPPSERVTFAGVSNRPDSVVFGGCRRPCPRLYFDSAISLF